MEKLGHSDNLRVGCTVCSVKYAVCSMHCVRCSIQYAYAVNSIQCVVCTVHCELCIEFSVYICTIKCSGQWVVCSYYGSLYCITSHSVIVTMDYTVQHSS